MKPFLDDGDVRLYHGDCRVVMASFDAWLVDAVVTDPPYELGFMGKAWDASGIAYDVNVWREALRVLKPGGHLLAFGGTRTYHRMACAIEDAGFEIRDCLQWLYGSGFPKSHNLDGEWDGWGTALKPANEPVVLARRPFKGTVAANVAEHGTGALNIDACRIAATDGYCENAVTQGVNTARTSYEPRRERRTFEPQPSGRWPANVILDDAAATILDAQSGVSRSTQGNPDRGTARKGMFANSDFNRVGAEYEDSGGASRFFYTAKASRAERNDGVTSGARPAGSLNMRTDAHAHRTGNASAPAANHHPTVKPVDLMRYLARLITPPNGLVLDPFIGSGTTAVATRKEGFRCIGIDLSSDYLQIAAGRLSQQSLLSDGAA